MHVPVGRSVLQAIVNISQDAKSFHLTPLKSWNVFGNSNGEMHRDISKIKLHITVESRTTCQWYFSVLKSSESHSVSSEIMLCKTLSVQKTDVKRGEETERERKGGKGKKGGRSKRAKMSSNDVVPCKQKQIHAGFQIHPSSWGKAWTKTTGLHAEDQSNAPTQTHVAAYLSLAYWAICTTACSESSWPSYHF